MKNPSVQLISGSKWEKTLSAWSQNFWYCKTNTSTTTSTTKSRTICGLRSKRMRSICYILTVSVCFLGVAFCSHLQRTEETSSRLKALTSCTHATRRVTCSHSAKTHISKVNSDFDVVFSDHSPPGYSRASCTSLPPACITWIFCLTWASNLRHRESLVSLAEPPVTSSAALSCFTSYIKYLPPNHVVRPWWRQQWRQRIAPFFLQEATTFVFNRDILTLRKGSSIVKWCRNLDNLDRIQR